MDKKLKNITVYLVGGAVRDQLLGLPVTERDWVVVGSTPEEMIARGFRPVGKEFPVFLHPQTHEEYALARTEKKISKGYKGFTFYTSPNVTLEEDLIRRDLTINAMALSEEKQLIDPFNGQKDLEHRILRHVSPAFMEDPVRILRIARFAARFSHFKVAQETNEFMSKMVELGEIDALVSERVWQEFEKALKEIQPQRFFEVLADCNALSTLFPEIQLNSVGMNALKMAVEKSLMPPLRFAALLHELSAKEIKNLCQRLKVSLEYSELAILTGEWFPEYLRLKPSVAEDVLKLIKVADGLRRPERFQNFLRVCEVCALVQQKEILKTSPATLLNHVLQALQTIDIKPLLQKGLKGKELGDAVAELQLQTVRQFLNSSKIYHQ